MARTRRRTTTCRTTDECKKQQSGEDRERTRKQAYEFARAQGCTEQEAWDYAAKCADGQ